MEVDNGLMNGEGTQLDSNSKVHSTPIDLHSGIDQVDPEIADLIHKEKNRQIRSLELIASENFTSQAVLDCLGSCFTNRYCEGYPGRRYYGGQEYCDALERICQQRAMEAYNLDSREWGVNVQPYSGSPANFAVYTAIVEPHGRIMGLDLPDGGHLTHGFQTTTRKVSATSIFFESLPYKVSPETGLIDYDMLSYTAKLFQPKLIIAGMSCYPRNLDYHRFRQIADKVGCFLMADMAHVSGLVAAGACANPFPYCDIVTTTTHKSLRGPRAGMIFYRKGVRGADKNGKEILYNLENRINTALFPGLQGGPHMHQIAGIAVALKQAKTEEFASYINAVVSNAKLLGECLVNYGYTLVTGGTDTHLILVNFKPQKLAGSKVEYVLERMSITANKNTCPGDVSAFSPSGLRLGTPALTSRGFGKQEFIKVAEMVHLGIQLCQQIQSKCTSQKLDEFKNMADKEEFKDKINTLRMRVEEFACVFPMPGAMN